MFFYSATGSGTKRGKTDGGLPASIHTMNDLGGSTTASKPGRPRPSNANNSNANQNDDLSNDNNDNIVDDNSPTALGVSGENMIGDDDYDLNDIPVDQRPEYYNGGGGLSTGYGAPPTSKPEPVSDSYLQPTTSNNGGSAGTEYCFCFW